MKITYFLFVVLTLSTSISKVIGSVGHGSFFESDVDFKRIHRNLLQEDDENEDTEELNDVENVGDDNSAEETEKKKGLFEPGINQLGPTLFYTDDFLLQVDKGVEIKKSDGTSIILDASAVAIAGSYIVPDQVYQVTIDWKNKEFRGMGMGLITMEFNKSRTEFILIGMKALIARTSYELKISSTIGYKVRAPRGLAFACDSPGLFEVEQAGSVVGITFPGMKIQVFFKDSLRNLREFGPLWYCGELMPIGLWVGIIVSISFTLICYWGFSMLASIQTMDRFDDPKGKQIYVPQTD